MFEAMTESMAAGKSYRNCLWLKISPAVQKAAWQEARDHSNSRASYNAYVNRACLASFMEWFSDWLEEEFGAENKVKAAIWPSEDIGAILEVVNGTALQAGEARLALIPRDETDPERLCVPQEWVDTPWAADYYLAIRTNLEMDEEDCWICVCGFATHRQLKQEAEYSSAERAYILSEDALINELAAMQITLGMRMREAIAPLPVLAPAEAKKLLRQLGDAALYSPRLQADVPFEKWAALLVDNNLRQELHDRRMGRFAEQKAPIFLRQWLENLQQAGQDLAAQKVAEGWQAIEDLFAPAELSPARSAASVAISSPDSSLKTIAPVIRLTEPNQPEEIRRQAAGVLGELGLGKADAIGALIQLLQTAREDRTRWQAALSLGKIDPGHPQAGVRNAKLVDLGMQLAGHLLALVVAIMPRPDGKLGVFLQVKPEGETKLPPGLKMSLLSERGETRREVETRCDESGQSKDDSIQIVFSPPPGTCFRVRVALGDASIVEDFAA